MRILLAVSTSATALALASFPAAAKTVGPSPKTASPKAAAGGATPTANDGQSQTEQPGLEDIIVTAQRREQSLQRTALPVSVLSGDAVSNASTTRPEDLSNLIPAVHIAQQAGAFTLFYLRGVGSFGGNSLSDSATAFNYDGVYLSRPSSTYGVYFDLDRVEVLKGPQGTLYGRNATGGAINIIPRRPELGRTSAEGTVDYGNYDALTLSGDANIALGEKGAMRVSGQFQNRDGYENDGTSDARGRAVRAQMMSELTDRLTVRLSGDYSHIGGRGPGAIIRLANGTYLGGDDARIGFESPQGQAYLNTLPARPFLVDTSREDNGFWGTNLQVDLETGIGTFTFIPAYRRADLDFVTNAPGFTIQQREKQEQFSSELRLASPAEKRLGYVLGLYYLDEQVNTNTVLYGQSPLGTRQIYDPSTKSFAAFGQLTFRVTDALRLVGGARYTSDHKRVNILLDNPAPTPDVTVAGDRKFDKVTWRGAVEFDAGAHNLLYASVETGFKAGGFSLSGTIPQYKPETITAYTIGSKNRFLSNKLLINLEAFWWKYRDQQYSFLGGAVFPGAPVIPTFATQNVGNATIKGAEAELQFLPTPTTLLGVQAQYLDAKYDSFSIIQPQLGPFPPNVGSSCRVTVPTPGLFNIDCGGARLPFSAEWTLNLAAQQTIRLSGGGSIVGNVNARYESAKYAGTEFLPAQLQPGVWTEDASLTLNLPGNHFSITAYGRNLSNRTVLSQTFVPFASRAYVAATVRAPRTYGVRASLRF